MFVAELFRRKWPAKKLPYINSNDTLRQYIINNKIDKIFLFKAGLIINKQILNLGVKVYNVHVTSLADYPGLGTIARALHHKSLSQTACLYRVEQGIDTGDVIDFEPYLLNPSSNYMENENMAYNAGIRLMYRTLLNRDRL